MKNTNTQLYKLLSDGYSGTGGFLDGSYLARHPREAPDKYAQRKELAYYLNYLAPCVNAHVDPIFRKKPNREWRGRAADVWARFCENTDYTGTALDALMKRAAEGAKLYGVNFIVMDNGAERPANLKDMLDKRAWPYAFIVEPGRVKEIKTDQFGRVTCFSYAESDPADDFKQNVRTFTAQGWKLTSGYGGARLKAGGYNLGQVPVIALRAREGDHTDHFPASEFISIARTNLAIYNMTSWLTDILVNQTFSVLTYPDAASKSDLTLGTNNALRFDPEARHQPGFIAPPAEPANILAAQIDRLQKECYRMATVVNVTGVRQELSGMAKAWDFECTNQLLAGFSDNIENAERKLAALFANWLNMDLEYTVNYPSDFSVSDLAAELNNAELAKGLNFGAGFDLEVFKRVLAAYLPELPASGFDRLVGDYREELAKAGTDLNHAGT